jgi:hypothetical protein
MEETPLEVDWIVIIFGKTYPIKEELKAIGFQWNPANSAWYHLGLLGEERIEYMALLINDPSRPGVSIRYCLLDNPISLLA